jgi:hypothetical protein
MTLEKHWPSVIKMFTTTNCYPVPKDEWYKDPEFRARILEEYAKIAPYREKGYIVDINIKKMGGQIAHLPKPAGPTP